MEKWALITGASSGIGAELAKIYAKRGYGVILVARRTERLTELAMKLETPSRIISCDLRDREAAKSLYDMVYDLNVEIVVNNAGFGAVGRFEQIDLDRQLDMIDLNCTAVTAVTYMFLKDFRYRDCGAILNVASSAGLMPGGPNMAMYYATKAFVVSLTNAVNDELKASGSSVKISALCPGPVDTEFNDVAGVSFGMKGISAKYCAMCAAYGLDHGERIIIPERSFRLLRTAAKLSPERAALRITGLSQRRKTGDLGG